MASYGNNTFQYGADGIRYKKNNTEYTLDGNKILQEKDGTKTIKYYYGNGGVVGFNYNGTDYYYEKNLQGDITAIYNTSGVKQAEYVYDAWGKILSMTDSAGNDISNNTSHVGYLNPFRYRGYYYDVETDLYYLESRYYDPETGRFLNADSLKYLGKGTELSNYNLYQSHNNNPIQNTRLINKTHRTKLDSSNAINLVTNLNITIPSISNDNYWNPHWENKWVDTDWPGIFQVSNSAFELINWGLTIYKGSLYFDNNEQHSVYNGSLNISIYAGANFEKKKFGVELGGSVGRLGYNGRFIDIQVDFITAKFFYIYENGEFKMDPGFGWVDFGGSIDIAAMIECLKGGV